MEASIWHSLYFRIVKHDIGNSLFHFPYEIQFCKLTNANYAIDTGYLNIKLSSVQIWPLQFANIKHINLNKVLQKPG